MGEGKVSISLGFRETENENETDESMLVVIQTPEPQKENLVKACMSAFLWLSDIFVLSQHCPSFRVFPAIVT
jgi:hypothetical protein